MAKVRREYKTYAGEPIYIYYSICNDCLGHAVFQPADKVFDEDGQDLELEGKVWALKVNRPELAAPVTGRQMTLDEVLQLNLFKEVKES